MTAEEQLMEWGLTSKEARVYIAALELGSTTVTEIAKRTRIFRTYCYDIIRSLGEKGLISPITKGGVQYFEAANPDKLVELLEARKISIRKALPQLKILRKSAGPHPKAELFEGVGGIKSIHEDILASGKESYLIGDSEKIIQTLGPYFDLYIKRRVEKKLTAFVITEDTPSTRKRIGGPSKSELRQVRFNKNLAGNKTTLYFYDDKVALLTYEKEPFGVIIENKSLYRMFRLLFDELWRSTPSE